MKILTILTMSLMLFFSISQGMEEDGMSHTIGDLDEELGTFEPGLDQFLAGLDCVTVERIKARIEAQKDQRVFRRGHQENPTRELLQAIKDEVALKEQEVALQREKLFSAKESSKKSDRFAWVGLGVGAISLVTGFIFQLINSLATKSTTVECVCNCP